MLLRELLTELTGHANSDRSDNVHELTNPFPRLHLFVIILRALVTSYSRNPTRLWKYCAARWFDFEMVLEGFVGEKKPSIFDDPVDSAGSVAGLGS